MRRNNCSCDPFLISYFGKLNSPAAKNWRKVWPMRRANCAKKWLNSNPPLRRWPSSSRAQKSTTTTWKTCIKVWLDTRGSTKKPSRLAESATEISPSNGERYKLGQGSKSLVRFVWIGQSQYKFEYNIVVLWFRTLNRASKSCGTMFNVSISTTVETADTCSAARALAASCSWADFRSRCAFATTATHY